MKVCIFSDIHGNQVAFEQFIKLVINQYDAYIFAGDVFGYYYGIDDVLNMLNTINPLYGVLGNHDYNYLEKIQSIEKEKQFCDKYGMSYKIKSEKMENWANKMSIKYEMEIDSLKIAIVHGTLENPLEGREYPDTDRTYGDNYRMYDVVIQGHTHCKMLHKYGKTMIINPGSIGQCRNKDGCTYAVFDTKSKNVIFKKISWDKRRLYQEINDIEPRNKKLIDVLEREK